MAISLTQNVGVRSSGASVTVPYGSAIGGGSLLTLVLRTAGAALTSTITDSAANTWLRASGVINAGGTTGELWYAANAAASTNTVTIVNSEPATALQVQAQEWAQASTATTLIASTTAQMTAVSTHSAGTVTTNASSAVVIVGFSFASAHDVTVPPSGYTEGISTFTNLRMYYRLFTSTTTESPTITSSNTEITANVLAAFSGSSGGGAVGVWRRRTGLLMGTW